MQRLILAYFGYIFAAHAYRRWVSNSMAPVSVNIAALSNFIFGSLLTAIFTVFKAPLSFIIRT